MQFRLVGIWAAVLPVAVLPLWQLAQLVALVNPAWSMPDAGNHPEVLWQLPQEAVVWMWPDGLPTVVAPLWQLPHALAATPAWSNLAPTNVAVVWQLSQPSGD